MPFVTEHAARVKAPSAFVVDSFVRTNVAPGIDRIMGKPNGGSNELVVQSYRFHKQKHTSDAAQKWIKDHGIQTSKFEEAIKTNSNTVAVNLEMGTIAGTRTETKDGVDYIVAPVVMMVEGVHNSIYYSSEELGKFPEAWNGQPVVIRHPDVNGTPVSANASPDMMEIQVGKLFNTLFEDKKLKSEIWAEKSKMETQGASVIAKWAANQMINVSIGAFEEDLIINGTWGNEAYSYIATNIRPDHLAMLPDELGACSIADGAGTPRVNTDKFPTLKKALNAVLDRFGVDRLDGGNEEDEPDVTEGMTANELAHGDIRRQLSEEVSQRFGGEGIWTYVEGDGVFDDSVVYTVEPHNSGMKYYKLGYTMSNDVVKLDDGAPVEVIPKQTYEVVPVINNQNPHGGNIMEEKVNALIANQANQFTEADREMLTGLGEATLDKMGTAAQAPSPAAAPAPAAAPVVNAAGEPTMKDLMVELAKLPQLINDGVEAKLALNSRQPVIDRLTAEGTKCPFSAATLTAMTDAELVATEKQFGNPLVAAHADYSGMAGVVETLKDNADNAPEPMGSVFTDIPDAKD